MSVNAADSEAGTRYDFGGLAFGDAYFVENHHTAAGDGAAAAVLRRLYLTLDMDFGDRWYARLRTETNQSGEFETYSFEHEFKDLYLGWTNGRHDLTIGLSPTPTFDLIESVWGHRYLMRTPLDLQGVASRDTGVAARGRLTADGQLLYRVMGGAGVNFGNESGDGRKWMGAVTWKPSERWSIDLYADHEKLPGPADRTTVQVFAGYQGEDLVWGAQYSDQDRQQDPPLELASAFIVRPLSEKLSLIGRVDRIMKPSPAGDNIAYLPFDPSAPATMLLGAIEFGITPQVLLTPNIVWTTYDRNDEGVRPSRDTILRLTLFLNFE